MKMGLPLLLEPRLRVATPADMLLYFEWANDPEVRRNSFTQRPISLAEHEAWFARKLKSADVLMLVLEIAGSPAGQIRFEVDGEIATIGFAVAAHARGRGLGTRLLSGGISRLHVSHPRVLVARGLVRPENRASRRAFESAGFTQVLADRDDGNPIVYEIEVGQ